MTRWRDAVVAMTAAVWLLFGVVGARAQTAKNSVLAFYSTQGEPDHVAFNLQAVDFFRTMAARDHYVFDATTDWARLNREVLARTRVVIWLNGSPSQPSERLAFQNYMEHGGGWLGFHGAGYQSSRAAWPWFAQLLGGVFSGNSWPPLPARLVVNQARGPLTRGMPRSYLAPANEWYSWEPDPRHSPGIRVLLTLDPSNFPLGFKNTLDRGDIPVAWTNTHYRMVYINMGHGDKIFTSAVQNRFIEDALLWLSRRKAEPNGVEPEGGGARLGRASSYVNQ